MSYHTAIAIILGIISYSMLNIGMGLQKKGAAMLPKIEQQSVWKNLRNFFTNKTWLIGFALVQIQWAFLSIALDLTKVSIITPLMSIGMVTLVIFSYFYLKEPISKIEIGGILAIITGIVVLGATNNGDDTPYNLDFIFERMGSLGAIIFLTIAFVISIIFILASSLRKFKNADVLFSFAAGITDALGAIFLRAYMAGAQIGDRSVIAASAKLWGWWVIFVFMVTLNATATIYLQVAYQRGKAVIVAPIFAVLAMITPVFGGIIIFNECQYFVDNQMYGVIAGKIVALVIVSLGAIVLSVNSARRRRFDKSNEEELQEPIIENAESTKAIVVENESTQQMTAD